MQTLRDRELRRVLEALGGAGISCLLIKGAALAHTLYRHPHLRHRSDADLLVKATDSGRVAALLEQNGYRRAPEISGAYATSQMHFDRPESPDHRYALDIHWRIVNTHAFAEAMTFETLAASRVPVHGLGPSAWTLSTPHALALACIHRVAHHQDADDLQWLWDVHLLVPALRDQERRAFPELAKQSGARAVIAHTLRGADARFGTPGAAALAGQVAPAGDEAVERSARFLSGRLSLAGVLRSDLASLGWRGRASLLREHLFPPAAYMRSAYAAWPAALLPAAYLHRIVCGAPKWLRRP